MSDIIAESIAASRMDDYLAEKLYASCFILIE